MKAVYNHSSEKHPTHEKAAAQHFSDAHQFAQIITGTIRNPYKL
jgi:hypothetical protein